MAESEIKRSKRELIWVGAIGSGKSLTGSGLTIEPAAISVPQFHSAGAMFCGHRCRQRQPNRRRSHSRAN
jgi:hypothetical protein